MSDNKFGNLIVSLRKEKGLTQKDLAEELCVSDKAVSRWELGHSSPNLEMIFQISKFFGVSFNDMLKVRVDNDDPEDKLVREIVEEFNNMGKKRHKRMIYLLTISLIIILLLTITIIFTNTFNRFKVYKVEFESSEFYHTKGMYVETNIRDTLYLGDLKIKGLELKDSDTVSVDIYILENEEEKIIQNYSSLENIYLVGSQSYVEINDLSKYFDNLYIRVRIIDSKGQIQEYEAKLNFVLDFSNNKIFYEDEYNVESVDYEITEYNDVDIKSVLLKNGFKEENTGIFIKEDKNYNMRYLENNNIINYTFDKNGFSYKYTYCMTNNILKVLVFDENSTEIQNYNYDVKNNAMECNVGKCNDYKKVLTLLEEKVLYLFKD